MELENNEVTQGRISQLASDIAVRLRESIGDIQAVNDDIHVLSINAKILAAKAGASGKAFAVVADFVRAMVGRTQRITEALQKNVESTVTELRDINRHLATKVRASRLSQVAENMIDIVDRNLYERSCDVRWWATEAAVSRALETGAAEDAMKCCERLGVILDSYTVYLDIVVCDLAGRVIANGRPGIFPSVGRSVTDCAWFNEAIRTASGNEYGFEGVHASPLVKNRSALVYSCGVRENGDASGQLVGVLGVIFNWEGLGSVVVERAEGMLSPETDHSVRALLAYPDGTIIASACDNRKAVPEPEMRSVRSQPLGVILPDSQNGNRFIAGFAASRGFETYKTGWFAIIEEDADGY